MLESTRRSLATEKGFLKMLCMLRIPCKIGFKHKVNHLGLEKRFMPFKINNKNNNNKAMDGLNSKHT